MPNKSNTNQIKPIGFFNKPKPKNELSEPKEKIGPIGPINNEQIKPNKQKVIVKTIHKPSKMIDLTPNKSNTNQVKPKGITNKLKPKN